ncbi:MAG: hypothetical protein WC666_02220 [Candidatus Paceibacterota bacterium]|jgi:hypothetical protein
MRRKTARKELKKDLFFILLGVVIAIILSKSGVISWFVDALGSHVAASFVAGIFWTSAFTIAPSSLALANIANSAPAISVAFWGGLGAMCGDLILFFFIRDRLADDIMASMKPSVVKHILSSFHLGFLKWLSPILGALIIASPLPDEFALTLMGLSKVRIGVLIPVSFIMNTVGIYGIVWFAQVI